MSKKMRSKTSACVIVRNEEENLPRWLACMQELADEMIVVDTGSTDKTVQIARNAGAHVFTFPWINDFSAAKNYAIEQAQGGWIFFLDADEYWEPQDFVMIRKTLQQYDKQNDIIGFVCRLVNIDKDNHNRRLNESMHIRIFRNLPQLRYRGAVHEQLVYSGTGKKKMLLLPKAVIYHTGYSASTDIPKAERNLAILLAQQQAGKGQDSDICYITDCYYSLKDYAKAAESAREAIAKKVILPGRETRMYNTLLQSLQNLGYSWQELLPIVVQAEQDFPHVPDFRALLGFTAWRQGDKQAAQDFFRRSKELYQEFLSHREDVTASYTDEMQGFLPKIEEYLAMAGPGETERRGRVKISAAVITKNEEEDLPTWLECMRHLAEEIIVVDTGSTDRTVEIAKAAGAEIVHFDWIDDFAAAKNFAIDQVHGDWVLLLDADEFIRPEEYGKLKEAIARYDKDDGVIGLASDWINIDKKKNNAYISKGYQIRVFRKLPELRYVHMIHELLQYRGPGKKTMPYVAEFSIYHTGYSSGRMPAKFERNLRLLKLSQEKYGKRSGDDMYLADCYYGLKQYEKAIEYAKAYLDGPDRAAGGENRPFSIWIQSLMLLKKPLKEILPVTERALKELPCCSEFKIQEGFVRYGEGDYVGAERCYREAEQIYAKAKANNEWQKNLLTDEGGAMFFYVYADMCQLLLWQGKEAEAWEYLQKAMEIDRYKSNVVLPLLKFLAAQDDVAWIEALNCLYDKEKDASFLLTYLPKRGRDKVRLYYMRQLQKAEENQAENYMLAGRLEAASAAVAEDMAALLQVGIRGFAHDLAEMDKISVLFPKNYQAVATGQVHSAEQRTLARKTARIQSWLASMDGRQDS